MWFAKVVGNVLKGLIVAIGALILLVKCSERQHIEKPASSDNPLDHMNWTPGSK